MAASLDIPRPVTFPRVSSCLPNFSIERHKDGSVMLPFDDGLILILLLPSPQNVEVVEVQGRWRAEAPATWADALVEVATRVNAHNIMPKVTLVTLEDEEPKVSLVSSVPHFCPSGLSDAQLRAFLTQAIVYTSEFFSTLRTELPELVTWEETP